MTEEEQCRTDFKSVTDPDGIIQNKPNPRIGESGNGNLFTSEYHLILALRDWVNSGDKYTFNEVISHNCITIEMPLNIRLPLLSRASDDLSQNGQDDYIGVALISKLYDLNYAKQFYEYGVKHNWVFNNGDTSFMNLHAWLGKSPAFVCHMYFCAGVKPNIFLRLAWAYAVSMTGYTKPDNQDEWILSYLMIKGRDETDWLCNRAVDIWTRRFKKSWPGGFKDVFKRYFGWEHPTSKWWPDGLL